MADLVKDVMTRQTVCLAVTDSVAEAAHRMKEADIGDIIVETNDGKVCGIVTDRDIVVRALAEDLDPKTTALERICSKNLVTVSPEDSVDEVIKMMRDRAIRRVPVMDGDDIVGIVSLGDLAVERDPGSVLADISAAAPNE